MTALLCLECRSGPIKWQKPEEVEPHDFEKPLICTACQYVYEEGFKTYTERALEQEKSDD